MGYSADEIATAVLVGYLVCFLAVFTLVILGEVFLGLAAYHDARANGSTDGVMWGLLIGFFGMIPGIIYLCLRKKPAQKVISCPQCYTPYFISYQACPRCGIPNPASYPFYDPAIPEHRKKAKRDLILSIVFFSVAIIGTIIFIVCMLLWVREMATHYSYYYY